MCQSHAGRAIEKKVVDSKKYSAIKKIAQYGIPEERDCKKVRLHKTHYVFGVHAAECPDCEIGYYEEKY